MYNYPPQPLPFNSTNPPKFSLRQRHPQLKNIPQTFINKNQIAGLQTVRQTPVYQGNQASHNNSKQTLNEEYRTSFDYRYQESTRKNQQSKKYIGIPASHNNRTPSTTPSADLQRLPLENSRPRPQIDSKFSLKIVRKEGSQNSSSRFSLKDNYRPQLRNLAQSYSQMMSTDERPTDQHHSQAGSSSKYSLRGGTVNRKYAKPEVLLNLKYSDLVNMNSSRPTFGLNTCGGSQSGFVNRNFCNGYRSAQQGCKCQPKCYWMSQWLSLIGDHSWSQTQRKPAQPQWQAILKQIQRDIPRTQPDHPSFQCPQMLQKLRQVLTNYAQLDIEVGYVQGMNFVAATLVYHCSNSFQALRVFYYMMVKCGYRKLFLGELDYGKGLAGKLAQDVRKLIYDLYCHLMEEGIELELFAQSWYFSLCGSYAPLQSMHFLIDKFLKKGFTGINELILTLLLLKKQKLMKQSDSELMMSFSNQQLCKQSSKIDWQQVKDRSQRLLLSPQTQL